MNIRVKFGFPSFVFFSVLHNFIRNDMETLSEVKKKQPLDPEDKATIHYTFPQNLLMEPERNVLIRDLIRLNNIISMI